MKPEHFGKIFPGDIDCVLLRNSTSVTNLLLHSFLLASCLPSPNPKRHFGAKQNQQLKSEIKWSYQSDKALPGLCSAAAQHLEQQEEDAGLGS